MSTSKLMKVTYYDPKSQIRLLCYADTVVWDTKPTPTLTALRFGGYPERVQGLADAIYGGATIEIEDGKDTYSLKTLTRQYGDAFESMYILAKGKPKTVHILKDKPNKWAGTKTWGCLTKREVDGTLTPKGRKTIQKFGARTNVWHYGTVLPMESELFGGKAVSLSERLAEDHIRTWSNEGDLVLAPFDKDGTVAKIAPLLERRWLSLQNAADCDGLRDNAG